MFKCFTVFANTYTLKHIFPVNRLRKQRSSDSGPTLVKMLVISFLVHAAVISLIPSVDLLPQPSLRYFEIETVSIESEEHDILSEDEQGGLPPENMEQQEEAVTPLSDYEPLAPEMINKQQEQPYSLLIPQQHSTLPETLENVNTVISPQRLATQADLPAIDIAVLPARAFDKTKSETAVNETHRLQEFNTEVIVTADQPYDRVGQNDSVVIQEMLPDLKRSQLSEVFEQANIPFLAAEPIMKRTTHSDAPIPERSIVSDIPAFQERPPLRMIEEKTLPQNLPAEQARASTLSGFEMRVEARAMTISAETEPEFRPAQAVLLPTSHSQDRIDVSEPVLKSVHRPTSAMENLLLLADKQSTYVRSEEQLTDSKAIPAIVHDQIRSAENIDRPALSGTGSLETISELQDREFLQSTKPAMTQIIGAPQRLYSPVSLTKNPRSPESLTENIERKMYVLRQKKVSVQEEKSSQKMFPAFQSYSTFPALVMAIDPGQLERVTLSGEEDLVIVIPKLQLPDVTRIEEHQQPSSDRVPSVLRTRQVLMTQDVLASAPLTPFISSEKMLTAIDDTFGMKKKAQDIQEPEVKIIRRSQSMEQHVRETAPETLQRPQKLTSRPESDLAAAPKQILAFEPEQRSFVFGAERDAAIVSVQPVSVGMFVRKDVSAPDVRLPEKTIQLDDALQRINTETPEEGPASVVIEGPASMRQVISKPLHLPEIDLDVEVTIRLQFWVLPDGSVGEVVPLQRGDVRLERAAIQYLKSWRFTPLSSGNQTVWGIIPITYRLR